MIIFPAIDLRGGQVVRLKQGRFDNVTVYSDDPVQMAKQWVSLGAQWLHIVDLDGAQTGHMDNKEIIQEIAQSIDVPMGSRRCHQRIRSRGE